MSGLSAVEFTVSVRGHMRTCVCVYLLREHVLFRLQCVAVLQALVAAGLCVAPVLERAALLLEAHHLVLADAAQVSVELAHRQAHQLLVREALIDPALPRTWDTHTHRIICHCHVKNMSRDMKSVPRSVEGLVVVPPPQFLD